MDSSLTGDFAVEPLKTLEVWKRAKLLRWHLWGGADWIDLLSLGSATEIRTAHGVRAFELRFVSDAGMRGETGLTTVDGGKIIITLSDQMRHQISLGVGSARFVLARELGYAILHSDSPHLTAGNRPSGASAQRSWVFGPGSSRWQARNFAAALLINDATAWDVVGFAPVAIAAGIDPDTAQLYFADVASELLSPAPNPRILAMGREFRQCMPKWMKRQFPAMELERGEDHARTAKKEPSPNPVEDASTPASEIDFTEVDHFQIREIAKRQRRQMGWDGHDRVNPLELERCSEIWTMDGPMPFRLEFTGDSNRTEFRDGGYVIRMSERTRQQAIFGDGYARFAIARELGHAALAHHRRRRDFGSDDFPGHLSEAQLQARTNEFQASMFACALMIDDDVALQLRSPDKIALQAGADQSFLIFYLRLLFEVRQRRSCA